MIYETIMTYFNMLQVDENARYKSWEHCHQFFLANRHHPEQIDYLSLHLSTFLSSWGMLRGSTFLLQKDYKIHYPIVEIILDPRYEILWDCPAEELCNQATVALIFDCKDKMYEAFLEKTKLVNGKTTNGRPASDTLISKIMLGTFCCVPAYDQYFENGLALSGFRKSFISSNIIKLANLYQCNLEFKQAEKEIDRLGLHYPPAKIIDMYFWQIGFHAEIAKKNGEVLNITNLAASAAQTIKQIPRQDKPRRESGEIRDAVIDFIENQIAQAAAKGDDFVDLTALEISQAINIKNSSAAISSAMRKVMKPDDIVLHQTPSGKSSTEKIRYMIRS